MPAFIVILVILVIGVAAVIVVPKLVKIEKVEIDQQPDLDFPPQDSEEGAESDGESSEMDLDDGVSLKEKMELNGYFSEDGEDAAEEAAAPENPSVKQQNAQSSEELGEERFAETDRLTELKAGRAYLIDCQKILTQAKNQRMTYAAAYFDFDRFRFINSLKGLVSGDYVLTRASQELENIFPPGSQITRISADHFAVVFPVVDSEIYAQIDDSMKQMCEKIRSDMAIKGALRIRMGIAATNGELDYDIRILMHKANIARYCIKASRDETFRAYDESMLSSYLFGESALEDYDENQYDEEFVLYYTPVEDISLHLIAGCEVLARWTCEDGVDKSLPNSVCKSMIPTNSSKVIYQVCKTMSRWRKAGKQPLPICIPLPPTEFFKVDIDEFLTKVVSEFQLEPSLLNIVIDAPMARLDWSAVSHQIKRISDTGVRVGVDEIDTGYSNLDFLSELPVQFIKLHRSFMRGLEEGGEGRSRILQILRTARNQNMMVYLEGVDSQEQASVVGELGIRMIQGIYAGRPQKSEQFSQGLPEYVERKSAKDTVILDDAALNKGDYTIY